MSTLDLPRSTAGRSPGEGDTATLGLPNAANRRAWLLSVEQLAYLALAALALLAHVWGLGDRALHHDETLHASYSWYLYVGRGYIHDPLLHGPLLYYIGATLYFLFGDNDVVARLGPALAGTALTLTPYLIRRELGRPAALLAAIYLLLSPVTLYVGRFFRHDAYSVLCEMLVFVAVVRYSRTRRPGWLMLGAAAFGLMLVNQETSYLFLLIIGAPLVAVWLWQIYKPGLLLVAGLGVLVAALLFVLPAQAQVDGEHNAQRDPQTGAMLVERPGLFGWPPLETDDNSYALRVRNRADDDGGRSLGENVVLYLQDVWRFVAHPAVLLAIGLSLATLATLVWLIWFQPGRGSLTPWQAALQRGDAAATLFASLGIGHRWAAALAVLLAIYALFFSAFFTNLIGVFSGVAGSLLYWLAQHNVERGGQPDQYYPLILTIYEPLLLLFGGAAFVLLGRDVWRQQAIRNKGQGTEHRQQDGTPNNLLAADKPAAAPVVSYNQWPVAYNLLSIAYLAWWAFAALGIYTWAGEKMPWLSIHLTVPLTLLAAWGFQRIIWHANKAEVSAVQTAEAGPYRAPSLFGVPHSAFVLFACLFGAIVGLSFVLMTAIVGFGENSVLPPWTVPVACLVLISLLFAGAALRWGTRPAVSMLAVCLGAALSLYTVRSTVRLVYQSGDTPRELMVYTQTSPDVLRVVQRLEEASQRRGRGLAMPILYDNETVWSWYMRDFSAAERSAEQLSGPPDPSVQAVLMLQENFDRYPQNRQYLEGFVIQRYPLRWWFPEDQMYRLDPGWSTASPEGLSLFGQALRAPFDRTVDERLWKFFIFRDPGVPLGSSDFVVAVRPELAAQIGVGLGGSLGGDLP